MCASFCWPKMGSFVSALVRNCLHCQKAKVHRHVSLQATFWSRFAVFHTCMLIWLALSLVLQDFRIYSQWLTGRLAGQKRSRFLPPQPPTAQPPSCKAGSKGLESQTSSLVTGGPNSPLLCGPAFVRFSPSHTLRLLPIILSPMASWSASTAA